MKPRVLVPVSDGVEEIEFVAIVDVLRRAGAAVVTAGLSAGTVEGRSGIVLQPDTTLDRALSVQPLYDMVVLPGGLPNAHTLRDDPRVIELLRTTAAANHPVAAICAAPCALLTAGLLDGKQATSYPGCLAGLPAAQCSEDSVVVSGNIITSRGPGTAMAFSLALVEALFGKAQAEKTAREVLL